MKRIKKKYNAYMREYMRKRRQTVKGKEETRRSDKLRHKKWRTWIEEQKSKPCKQCGGKFPTYVMEFHHRESSKKEFMIGHGRGRTREAVIKEIAKCDLLCANCHRIIEYSLVA